MNRSSCLEDKGGGKGKKAMPFELAMEVWQFGKQPHGKGDRESNFRDEERESPEGSGSIPRLPQVLGRKKIQKKVTLVLRNWEE